MPNEIETVVERARNNLSTRAELPGMSLLEHLEELRRRIIWSALSVAACFGIAWYYAPKIADRMQQPIVTALQRLSSIFRIYVGWVLNREHEVFDKSVLLATVVSMTGAMMLSLSTDWVLGLADWPDWIRAAARLRWPT